MKIRNVLAACVVATGLGACQNNEESVTVASCTDGARHGDVSKLRGFYNMVLQDGDTTYIREGLDVTDTVPKEEMQTFCDTGTPPDDGFSVRMMESHEYYCQGTNGNSALAGDYSDAGVVLRTGENVGRFSSSTDYAREQRGTLSYPDAIEAANRHCTAVKAPTPVTP